MQRMIFENIGKELGVKMLDDWRDIPATDIAKKGGSGIVQLKYNSSRNKMLQGLYPQHPWNFPVIEYVEKGHWLDTTNQRSFLTKATKALNITNNEQWYRVSEDQIRSLGGKGLLAYFPRVLSVLDSEFPWQWHKFLHKAKRARQRWLRHSIKRVLPSIEVLEEHAIGSINASGSPLTVDVFVPKHDLAIEYQGEHHYHENMAYSQPKAMYLLRDFEKAQHCKDNGICLVPIPYWWPGDLDTLVATLLYFKPDLEVSHKITKHIEPLCEKPVESIQPGDSPGEKLMKPTSNTRDTFVEMVIQCT
eukprot:CAMPEP_0168525724 /NCGR_PEP_ID=MMETSP0405-20121227/11487_1 /TAXON_ID=498012 /ORGANISM="Trichosphaerium sp, Strain Am-I-7 wt" /LENGTH=303 /DNA_ID=CAMNT_0008548319 /DNA_START=133 /DNA_END=1044 /DNA_ORIENTATION=+